LGQKEKKKNLSIEPASREGDEGLESNDQTLAEEAENYRRILAGL